MTRLVDIHRHPIKGFAAEPLTETELVKGGGIPFDRHFAFVSGNKEDVPVPGQWVQPRTFLMLTVYPELARFQCRLSEDGYSLLITGPDGNTIEATYGEPITFDAANTLLRRHFTNGPHDEIRLVEQAGSRGNWDFSDTEISIINLATLRVISEAVGRDLERERFRGNLYIDGLEPWAEFRWPGGRLQIGDAELDILRPIQRCAMTSTEPGTGKREIDVPQSMNRTFGHCFCGVYAKVREGGRVAVDQSLRIVEAAAFDPYNDLPDRVAAPSLWPRFLHGDAGANRHATLRSPSHSWPLPEARPGQTVKFHSSRVGVKSTRHKIEEILDNGWLVSETDTGDILASGPYGR